MSKQIKRYLDVFIAIVAGIISTLIGYSNYFGSADPASDTDRQIYRDNFRAPKTLDHEGERLATDLADELSEDTVPSTLDEK